MCGVSISKKDSSRGPFIFSNVVHWLLFSARLQRLPHHEVSPAHQVPMSCAGPGDPVRAGQQGLPPQQNGRLAAEAACVSGPLHRHAQCTHRLVIHRAPGAGSHCPVQRILHPVQEVCSVSGLKGSGSSHGSPCRHALPLRCFVRPSDQTRLMEKLPWSKHNRDMNGARARIWGNLMGGVMPEQ